MGSKATVDLMPLLKPVEEQAVSRFRKECVGGAESKEAAPILEELEGLVSEEREQALKRNFASIQEQAALLRDECVKQAKVCERV